MLRRSTGRSSASLQPRRWRGVLGPAELAHGRLGHIEPATGVVRIEGRRHHAGPGEFSSFAGTADEVRTRRPFEQRLDEFRVAMAAKSDRSAKSTGEV